MKSEIDNNHEHSSDPSGQNLKRILPGLIISALSLAVIFYVVDFQQFINALRFADYRFILLAGLLAVLWVFVRTFAWRSLLQGQAVFWQVFFTVNEGYLLNNILPFRLGEIGRSFLLSEKSKLSFWGVFSTILIERALDVALAAGLLLITLPFVVGGNWAFPAAAAAILLVIIGLMIFYLIARNNELILALFEKWTIRWPTINRLGQTQLPLFFNGLTVLTDTGQFARSLLLFILNWGVAVIQYYCLMLAFFPEAKLLWAGFSLSVAALGIALPSSPGAVGVFELTTVAALTLLRLDPSTALAYAITAHIFNYLITGVLGAYGFARDGETITGIYYRIRGISLKDAA